MQNFSKISTLYFLLVIVCSFSVNVNTANSYTQTPADLQKIESQVSIASKIVSYLRAIHMEKRVLGASTEDIEKN